MTTKRPARFALKSNTERVVIVRLIRDGQVFYFDVRNGERNQRDEKSFREKFMEL